ncbi:hypothetical protein D3C78_1458430 [compost metagenome]
MRTGVTAPQPAGDGGPGEQRKGAAHQQCGEVDEVLRPDGETEQVKLAVDQVEQHRLAPVPLQPGQAEVEQLGGDHEQDAPVVEQAADAARMDLFLCLIQRHGLHFRFGRLDPDRDVFQLLAHAAVPG